MTAMPENPSGVWYVYDGECPLCQTAANYFRLKETLGTLHLLNARTDPAHPILQGVKARGINLDEGFVIIHDGRFYHGKTALRYMSDIGKEKNWFNCLNKLFHSETSANFFYPWMKGIRGLLLRLRGVRNINNLSNPGEPIFKPVFGANWDDLPRVMQRHYASRPYHDDRVTVEGALDVMLSPFARILSPLFKLTGTLIPYSGKKVPITVNFISRNNDNTFTFDRILNFPNKSPYHFRSSMFPIKGDEMIEATRSGLGWHCRYIWWDESVMLLHKGYVFKFLGWFIPLPLTWLIGKTYAEEIAIDDDTFDMSMEIFHPLWGTVFGYAGRFKIVKDRHDDAANN